MINIIGQAPSPGSKNNPIDSSISLVLKSDQYGIKLSSIIGKINGEVALINGSFTKNFESSSIEYVDSDIHIEFVRSYNFNLDDIIDVEITAENLRRKRSNQKYYFEIEKSHPVLIKTNLLSKITEDSVIFMEFADSNFNIDTSSLNISIDETAVIVNGSIDPFFDTGNSSIDYSNNLIIKIDHPEIFRNGKYNLKYSLLNDGGGKLSGNINFEIDIKKVMFPDAFPVSGFVGPVKGISFARNLGTGESIEVEAPEIRSRSNKSEVFYLIYHKDGTDGFFKEMPKIITSNPTTVVSGLNPNEQVYWAVRCLESYKGVFSLGGMYEMDTGYVVPDPTFVFSEFSTDSLILYVDSTDGYPDSGLLVLADKEVVRYDSIDRYQNYFVISKRGLNNTSNSIFLQGDEVKLFLKCQDQNSNIIMGTPTYEDGYETDREYDGVGFIVNDYEDQNSKFFSRV
jgi:hypothetical protein